MKTNNKQAQYDGNASISNDERTIMDDVSQATSPEKEKKHRGRFIAGLGAAAAGGSGATILTSAAIKDGDQVDPETPELDDNVPAWSDGDVAVASGNYDDMTFSQAFAAARAEVGPGGAFEWHGKVYGTYLREEWQNMTAEEKSEWQSHFSWSHHAPASEHNANLAQADSHQVEHQEIADNKDDIRVDSKEAEEVPVVEVIGVAHMEDMGANVAVLSVDDSEVMLVDADLDETFDVLVADANGDGDISGNEVVDIQDSNITVADLGGFTAPDDSGMNAAVMYDAPPTELHEIADSGMGEM